MPTRTIAHPRQLTRTAPHRAALTRAQAELAAQAKRSPRPRPVPTLPPGATLYDLAAAGISPDDARQLIAIDTTTGRVWLAFED